MKKTFQNFKSSEFCATFTFLKNYQEAIKDLVFPKLKKV